MNEYYSKVASAIVTETIQYVTKNDLGPKTGESMAFDRALENGFSEWDAEGIADRVYNSMVEGEDNDCGHCIGSGLVIDPSDIRRDMQCPACRGSKLKAE